MSHSRSRISLHAQPPADRSVRQPDFTFQQPWTQASSCSPLEESLGSRFSLSEWHFDSMTSYHRSLVPWTKKQCSRLCHKPILRGLSTFYFVGVLFELKTGQDKNKSNFLDFMILSYISLDERRFLRGRRRHYSNHQKSILWGKSNSFLRQSSVDIRLALKRIRFFIQNNFSAKYWASYTINALCLVWVK